MKFDITQQPAFTTLVTLFAMSVAGAFALMNIDLEAAIVVSDSLLGSAISNFQQAHLSLSAIITAFVIFYLSTWLGHIISSLNIYGVNTTIHLFYICLLLWCSVVGGEFLLATAVACLTIYGTGSLLLSVRSNNYMGHIFNAMLAFSFLPTIYTPGVVMWLTVPIIWIIIGVTLRELIVSLVGLLLPSAASIYLFWLYGADIKEVAQGLVPMFMTRSTLFDMELLPLAQAATLAVTLLLSLLSLLWVSGNMHRTLVRFMIIALLMFAALATFAVPSASMISLALSAPTLSLLASFTMTQLRGVISNTIYLLLWVLLIAVMYVPIYLNLTELNITF